MQTKIKNLCNKLMYKYKMTFVMYFFQHCMLPSYLYEPPKKGFFVYDCCNDVNTEIINVDTERDNYTVCMYSCMYLI